MIRFRMTRVSVGQFAILKQEPPSGDYKINTSANIKHTVDGSFIAVDLMNNFLYNDEKFMYLQVFCEFSIHPEDLKSLTSDNIITVPKSVLDFFIAQTVGTARGILCCKTEGTPFNQFIMPPINVTHMINEDLVINLPS